MKDSSSSISLHFLAKEAKARLRQTSMQKDIMYYRGYDCIPAVGNNVYEKMIYAKVVNMIECNDAILNPLDRIIDHNVLKKCDDITKQKLMLEASKIYIRMKKKYYENATKDLEVFV